jgi:hypothetical protein
MKRHLFVCLVLIASWDSQALAVSGPEISAPYSTTALSVDGSAADWSAVKARGKSISFYKGDGHAGTPANLGTSTLGTITNEADCRVDLWLAHNATYLYVLAEVHDDYYEPFGAANQNMAYLEDTLHLYIDSTNARRGGIPGTPISQQAGYEQFGISTDGNIYGENTDFNSSGIPRQPAASGCHPDGSYWAAQCAVQPLPSGYLYVFEERVKLAGYPGRNMSVMTPGNRYGFDAEFCDADNGVQLQGYIWWSSNGSTDAWNYENLWGTMSLEPVPEPPSLALLVGALAILAGRKGVRQCVVARFRRLVHCGRR